MLLKLFRDLLNIVIFYQRNINFRVVRVNGESAFVLKPRHHPRHSVLVHMRIDLRGRQVHVPEQRLDIHELSASLQ